MFYLAVIFVGHKPPNKNLPILKKLLFCVQIKLKLAKLNTYIKKKNREELQRKQKEISWIVWMTRGSFDHCISQALKKDT